MIEETRSKHAVVVDKAIKARNRTNNLELWKRHRSTMDYTGYDHPEIRKEPAPKYPEKEKTKVIPETIPDEQKLQPLTSKQKELARELFLKQTKDKQIKDIQKRQNVITTQKQFSQYIHNPYGNDIEGIDTPSEDTEMERTRALSEISETPVVYNAFRGNTVGGFFINNMRLNNTQITPALKRQGSKSFVRSAWSVGERKPAVYMPTNFKFNDKKNDLFHELGHAFENKAYGRTGEFNLGSRNQVKINKSPFKNRDANKLTLFQYNAQPLHSTFGKVKNKDDLIKQKHEIITRFSGGLNHLSYRAKNEEKFANFFQGVITNPQKAKKVGYHYNVLKKTPMFKEYKRKNKELAIGQIAKLKSFKF